ncbi:MAG: dihydrodipicolinate synthase family protein [Nitriliruptorales bacterium]
MAEAVFEGVGVALATVFADDGAVDVDATVAHARRMLDVGVRAVVVAGSTGEAPALDTDERADLIRAVLDAVGGDIPVIAGTGAASARQAMVLTEQAATAGASAVLVLTPPRAGDPTVYYQRVAEAAGDMPVLGYHFPAMSPPGIPLEVLADLPIAGMKDSTGDAERLLRALAVFDRPLYVGSSALLVQAGALGCAGAILSAANLEPELCVAAFDGDAEAQRSLVDAHVAVARDFPHGLKQAMAERWGTSPATRMG